MTGSRFGLLDHNLNDGLGEIEAGQQEDEIIEKHGNRGDGNYRNQAIGPKGKGKRPTVVINEKQIAGTNANSTSNIKVPDSGSTPTNRTTNVASGAKSQREGESNNSQTNMAGSNDHPTRHRAADHEEHTLVQGGKKGAPLSSRIKNTSEDEILPPSREEGASYAHLNDPPSNEMIINCN